MTEAPEVGHEDPATQERPGLRVRARTVRIMGAVMAVVLVVAMIAVVWFATRVSAEGDAQKQRAAASNVATQFALRMDTFDGKNIDDYSKRVQSLLTTKYKAEFGKEFEPFKQVFTQSKATSTGKILIVGVGSSDADSVTVLVAHDALVISSLGNQQRHHRWSIDLVKVGGRWLVDDFKPVN